MIFVTGPGHSGPSLLANTYLEETLTEGSKRMVRILIRTEAC